MHPTCFTQIIGNEAAKRQLSSMVEKKAIGHALCFAGPDGIGKSLFAWAFACRILTTFDPDKDHARKIQAGQHPDIHVYRPEGKLGLHSIQSLRQFGEEVYLPPFEASWKVFIIHDADRMLSTSANALLKTFEEPPPRTVIILLSRSHAALLPTILSRCCTLHFHSLSGEELEIFLKLRYSLEDTARSHIARLAQGSAGRASRLAEQGDGIRRQLLDVFAQGSLGNYRALKESVQALGEQIEANKNHAEEAAKGELSQMVAEQLTAVQRTALEKELEGVVALILVQEAHALFEWILSWYRDVQILKLGGSVSHLENPDYIEALEQAVQRGAFLPLDQVQKYIEEASLALQRSTSLAICLESLFLKLSF